MYKLSLPLQLHNFKFEDWDSAYILFYYIIYTLIFHWDEPEWLETIEDVKGQTMILRSLTKYVKLLYSKNE